MNLGLQDLRRAAIPTASSMLPSPEIWVVLTHAIGDNDQCLALAEALGRPFRTISLDWPKSGRAFDRAQFDELLREDMKGRVRRALIGLSAPWPRLVICCGHRADPLAFWIKGQSGGCAKVVTIGRPHSALAHYDLVVAPPEYMLPARANVIHLPISMARTRSEHDQDQPAAPILAPKPWFTILLGGRVKQFLESEATLKQVAVSAQLAADRYGGSVMVSSSRRTPPWMLAAVESELTAPTVYQWSSRNADNPYWAFLQRSAAVFVTGDSTAMIRDACHSGAPTYLIELPDRMDIRRYGRRRLFGLIRKAAQLLRNSGLQGMAEAVDRGQDWLHAKDILRYPRDLRRFHSKVYEMGVARSAADFDPSGIAARRDVEHLLDASGVRMARDRCMVWLSPN